MKQIQSCGWVNSELHVCKLQLAKLALQNEFANFKQNITIRTLYYFIFVLKNGGKADPSKCQKTLKISASYLHFFSYFFKAIKDCVDSQLFGTVVRPIASSWCTGTGIAHPSSLLFFLSEIIKTELVPFCLVTSVADLDPGYGIRDLMSFWPLDPGLAWVKNQDQDPGSGSGMNNQDHIS